MSQPARADDGRWRRWSRVLGFTGGWDAAPAAHKALFDQAVAAFQGNPFTELVFFPWPGPAAALDQAPPRRTLLRATVCPQSPSPAVLAGFARLGLTDAFVLEAGDLPARLEGVRLHSLDPARPLEAIGETLARLLALDAPVPAGTGGPAIPLPGSLGEGVCVFTAAAFNYLPRARLLAESVRRYLPRAHLCLALADVKPEGFDPASCGFDSVVAVEDLADAIPDLPRWTFCHDVMERSTAIKPFVLERLLARPDCRAVFFFDPDCYLFSPPDELLERFADASILLTPHQTRPEASEKCMFRETNHLRFGVYNLGFLGVRNDETGRAFTDWWRKRLHAFCRIDLQKGLFTDQRWIDLAPVFFDRVGILRDSRYNLACWNFRDRVVTGHPDTGVLVDGRPVCFFHFAGTSGGYQKYMNWWGRDKADLQGLLDWYLAAMREKDDAPVFSRVSPYDVYDNGEPVLFVHRVLYREDEELMRRYPTPYLTAGKASFFAYISGLRLPPYSREDVLFGGACSLPGQAMRMHRQQECITDMRRNIAALRKAVAECKP